MFSTASEGNFVIGKLGSAIGNKYIVYNDKNLTVANPFRCIVDDDAYMRKPQAKSSRSSSAMCKLVTVSYEADHKLYQNKSNSTTSVTNFINGMFNSVSTIYLNEEINSGDQRYLHMDYSRCIFNYQ